MPGYKIFGKSVHRGCEDLVMSVGIEAIAIGSWTGTFAYLLLNDEEFTQYITDMQLDSETIYAVFAGGLLLSGLNLGVDVMIIRNALRGTVVNCWPRRTMGRWMAAKAILTGVTTAALTLTSKSVLQEQFEVSEELSNILSKGVQSLWVPTLLGALTCTRVLFMTPADLNRKDCKCKPVNLFNDPGVMTRIKTLINNKMMDLSKVIGMEGRAETRKITELFSGIFYENKDIVPSDITASFGALGERQYEYLRIIKRSEGELMTVLQNAEGSKCRPKCWMSVENAAYFMKYALASYGWNQYMCTSTSAFLGFCSVFCRSRYIPRPCPPGVVGDNAFLHSSTALCMATGLPLKDFIYISFINVMYEIPFYVAIDHKKKAIIISIRGTVCLQDIITDLMCCGEHTGLPNLPRAVCHDGMLTSAKLIYQKLTEGKYSILDQARAQAQGLCRTEQNYQLVVTGHSLGAGVAALLAMMLRETPLYRNLICFAFSPPGGLMSVEAARVAEGFVCSVVVEDDIVPRLGLSNILKLKVDVYDTIQNLDVPKYQVLGKPLERFLAKVFRPRAKVSEEGAPTWDGNCDASACVLAFQMGLEKSKKEVNDELEKHRPLYMPGCVLYIQGLNNFARGMYKAYYTRGDAALFQEIIYDSDLITDHMPLRVLDTLNKMVKERCPAICC